MQDWRPASCKKEKNIDEGRNPRKNGIVLKKELEEQGACTLSSGAVPFGRSICPDAYARSHPRRRTQPS